MAEPIKTEADSIIKLAEEKPVVVDIKMGTPEAAQVLIVRDQSGGIHPVKLKSFFDEYRAVPERRTGSAVMTDLTSFIAHVNRFKDSDSVVFATDDPTNPRLTAVLDYHQTGALGSPRNNAHATVYTFPLSEEWKTWKKIAGETPALMSQGEFAAFLEDRICDVLDPAKAPEQLDKFKEAIQGDFATPSKLLDLSRGLTIRATSKLSQKVSIQNGISTFVFDAEHQDEAGAPLRVPAAFLIGVPVFKRDGTYPIAVRLRYRVESGAVKWSCSIYQADRAFDDAIGRAMARVEKETSLPVLRGAAEK